MKNLSAITVITLLLSAAGARAQAFERQVFQLIRTSAASVKLVQAQAQQPSAADLQTTRAAREAYYNMASAGFQGLQADIRPDYAVIMGQPPTSQMQQLFDGFKFQIAVDAAGSAKMTSNGSTVPPEASEGFQQIYSGVAETLRGFFQTWSAFMIFNPVPAAGTAFALKREPKLYRYTYKDGDADVFVTMLKNFVVTEMTVAAPGFTSRIVPVYTTTQDGFLLTAYDAEYVPAANPAGKTVLRVDIAYQVVDGIQIPKRIALNGAEGGNPFKAAFDFENVAVQKRTP